MRAENFGTEANEEDEREHGTKTLRDRVSCMKFLNVDLNIESKSPLTKLVTEFGERAAILYSGRIKSRQCLYLETTDVTAVGQDAILNALCSLVESLSEKGRRLWETSVKKEFDLGYETRLSRAPKPAHRITIRPKTLRRITGIGASVTVTLYYRKES